MTLYEHETEVLIIGGGAAGLRTALELRRRRPLDSVLLVDPSPDHVYRPWLIYTAAGHLTQEALRVPHAELAKRFAHGFHQAAVTALDPDGHRVTAGDTTVRYQHLVLAAGAPADRARIPGGDEHALFPCDLEDAARFRERLQVTTDSQVVFVLSGERIGPGLEYAGWLARGRPGQARHRIALVADGDVLAEQFGAAAARKLAAWFGAWGAEVHSGQRVEAVHDGRVQLADGSAVPGDTIAVVGPLRGPGLPLLAPAVDRNGFIVVDECLRSPHLPDTFAVGDAVVRPGERWRRSWQLSVRQADSVAASLAAVLAGKAPLPFDTRAARRLSRTALPDVGGRSVMVINGRLLASGRLPRRLRLRLDKAHFRRLRVEGDRVARLPS